MQSYTFGIRSMPPQSHITYHRPFAVINNSNMKNQTLITDNGLIKARINPHEKNYFLVTNSDIESIRSTSLRNLGLIINYVLINSQ